MHGVTCIGGRFSIRIPSRAFSSLPCLPIRLGPIRLTPLGTTFQRVSASSLAHSRNSYTGLPRLPQVTLRSLSASTSMESNGHPRPKRKGSPSTTYDRPTKLFKPEHSELSAAMNESPNGSACYEDDGMPDGTVPPVNATADTAEWQATIEAVVKNVVSIHFCQTCSFDTSSALASEATGFVVDAAKGYILTNRHVVGSGPFWGYCIFDNHEEVGQNR